MFYKREFCSYSPNDWAKGSAYKGKHFGRITVNSFKHKILASRVEGKQS